MIFIVDIPRLWRAADGFAGLTDGAKAPSGGVWGSQHQQAVSRTGEPDS